MKTTEEMIAVMQAAVDGKRIQTISLLGNGQVWNDTREGFGQKGEAYWDWNNRDYRIKPEPKTIYAVVDNKGLLVYSSFDKSMVIANLKSFPKHGAGPYTVETYQQILD